jgi:hypothetical protein
LKAEKRTKRVTIRFSEDEYIKYLSIFENVKSNYTQSQFIRDCIFSTVPPKLIIEKASLFKPTACDKERIRQIAGLTSNINQIARNLNIMIKSSNQSKLLTYLKKIDIIYEYCESAMYEKKL